MLPVNISNVEWLVTWPGRLCFHWSSRSLSVGKDQSEEKCLLRPCSKSNSLLPERQAGKGASEDLRGRLESLPSWIANIQGLVKLNLKWSPLKEDPPETLHNLPNLVVLELLRVYNGKALCFKAKGFKKLKTLGLDYFEELRSIKVEEDALPNLEKLGIQRCKLLEMLPTGIEHLNKLKVLKFFDMPEELIRRIAHYSQHEDYQKVARVAEVYYGFWRDGRWDVQSIERSGEADPSPRTGESIRSFEFPPCNRLKQSLSFFYGLLTLTSTVGLLI